MRACALLERDRAGEDGAGEREEKNAGKRLREHRFAFYRNICTGWA
jgi:hypothetical protein